MHFADFFGFFLVFDFEVENFNGGICKFDDIVGEAAKEMAHRDTRLCQALIDACHESGDYKEGQRAFAEKRSPLFKGT